MENVQEARLQLEGISLTELISESLRLWQVEPPLCDLGFSGR
jgi:hypothetical protein